MALKLNITKEQFDKLPADVQKEYKVSSDGYVLDLDGYVEPAELKRAKDREKDRADEAERKLATVTEDYNKLKGDDVKKAGDIDALDRRWEKKFNTEKERLEGVITNMRGKSAAKEAETIVNTIAGKLSPKNAVLLKPHIASQIKTEVGDDGEIKVTMAGKDGKWVDYDATQLEKNFRDNKDFAGIVQASGASGGGAPAPTPGNTGGAGSNPPFQAPGGNPAPGGLDYMKGDPAAIIAARQAAKDAAGAQ